MSRDFEYSVTQLLDTRKELIEENYALDPEDQDEPGVKLHRTSRHTNLRVNYDQLDDSDDEESVNAGEVYSHIGGTHLHRYTTTIPLSSSEIGPSNISIFVYWYMYVSILRQ